MAALGALVPAPLLALVQRYWPGLTWRAVVIAGAATVATYVVCGPWEWARPAWYRRRADI